jgi:hypothetical protein
VQATVQLIDEELLGLGAILVEERVLRRIIKGHRDLRGFGQVPHEACYWLPKTALQRFVDRVDVAVDMAALPDSVIVVTGDRSGLATGAPAPHSALWRSIFHARVHQQLEELHAAGALGAAAFRERVHRLGQTELDAIRWVLRQEAMLLPPVDTPSVYSELVASYLELRCFEPDGVARMFPAIDVEHVDAVIAVDVDRDALLAASRPPRAPAVPLIAQPQPEPEPEPEANRPAVFVTPSARRGAEAARKQGNFARAAILAARSGDSDAARADLDELVALLSRSFDGADPTGWAEGLAPLVTFAASQASMRNAGSRLLYDLQAACVIAAREVEVADVIGWLLSRGKRGLVRPLPATRPIRAARRVRSAANKLAACTLASREARERLFETVHAIVEAADHHARAAYRPAIVAALHAVGLEPQALHERVAERTLVDELLDRAVSVGRLTLGDLRDAFSRNDLKLPDLQLRELATGDPLLRADQHLAISLDGVYRRGESYMRALQKLSSLLFGTKLGRVLTLYLLLPLVGSYALFQGIQQMGYKLAERFGYELQADRREIVLGGAAVLWVLLHAKPVRHALVFLLRWSWRVFRFLLFDAPLAFWRHRLVRAVRDSRFVRWLVRPAIPAAIALALTWQHGWRAWALAVAVFAIAAIVTNTRWIRLAEELAGDWIVRSTRYVGRILPGFVKLTLDLFAKLVDLIERGLYRVDEWLRFRPGQPRIVLVLKGGFGAVWFVVMYVVRLYVNLFVEPTVNPIKHFPVVTVAAKIILPFIPAMLSGIAAAATPLMGRQLGNGFAAFTVLVLPGLAGFLVWELKENWKLYRASRSKVLERIVIGHHGETMVRLLRPGFHSGTIPKLFTKRRRAAWRRDHRSVARAREALHHVEEAIYLFATRRLANMLAEAAAFRASDVAIAHVEIGANWIEIEVTCPSVARASATLRIELLAGWLLAGIARPGWFEALDDEQLRVLEVALAGFYKFAAIDLSREQLEHLLAVEGKAPPRYGVAEEGLLLWPGDGFETEVSYKLHSSRLRRRVRGRYDGMLPSLRGKHAMFGREPVYWSMWATAWQQIGRGATPMRVIVGPPLVRRDPGNERTSMIAEGPARAVRTEYGG